MTNNTIVLLLLGWVHLDDHYSEMVLLTGTKLVLSSTYGISYSFYELEYPPKGLSETGFNLESVGKWPLSLRNISLKMWNTVLAFIEGNETPVQELLCFWNLEMFIKQVFIASILSQLKQETLHAKKKLHSFPCSYIISTIFNNLFFHELVSKVKGNSHI